MLGVLSLAVSLPAHAELTEYSLGKLIYLSTGVILPNTDNNWVNRDGTDEFTFSVGTKNADVAPSTTQPPGIYNNGEFYVGNGSETLKIGAIAGFDPTTSLVSYNGTEASLTNINTVLGDGAAPGTSGALPGGSVVNPFKLGIVDTARPTADGGAFFLSTKTSDNIKFGSTNQFVGSGPFVAAKVFLVDSNFDQGLGFTPGQDVVVPFNAGTKTIKTATVKGGDYIIAFENRPDGNGDPGAKNSGALQTTPWTGDYNDMMLTASLFPIPEPAFYQMGALCLLGGVGVLRFRRKK